jgi:hypothetical protein
MAFPGLDLVLQEWRQTLPSCHHHHRANLRTFGRLCPIMSDRRNES